MFTTRGSALGGTDPITSRRHTNTPGSGKISWQEIPPLSKSFSTAESWQVIMGSKSTTKAFPGFDKIFHLGSSGSSRAFRGRMAVETDTFGLLRAEVHPVHPVMVDW